MRVASAEFLLTARAADQFRRDQLPEIAFVGRSNVGKSSLLNRLLGRHGLARTSSTPGRTQAVNYFLINRSLYFVDLPGFGYAKVSKAERAQWGRLMEEYFEAPWPRSLAVIQMVDAKVGATPLDHQAFDYLQSLRKPTIIVATKIDKVPRGQRSRSLTTIRQQITVPGDVEILPVSAETGEGVPELWKAISATLYAMTARPS